MDPIAITPRCPIRTTIELLGGKWKLLILHQLAQQPSLRFGELKRLLPDISERMLVLELKNLSDSGLIERHNFGEVPPRVEYVLTGQGRQALPLIREMQQFGLAYQETQTGRQAVPCAESPSSDLTKDGL